MTLRHLRSAEKKLRELGLGYPETTEHFPWGHRARKIKPLPKLPVGVFPAKQKVYVAPDYAAENSARVGALLVHRGGSRYWHYGWG